MTVGRMGERKIDFVCRRKEQTLYVQVAYLLADEVTAQREFGIYDSVKDNYPKYVVSMDELDLSRNGVRHWNMRDFLTNNDWSR